MDWMEVIEFSEKKRTIIMMKEDSDDDTYGIAHDGDGTYFKMWPNKFHSWWSKCHNHECRM